MKILFLWLMPILLIIGSTNEANARSKKKKGKAQKIVYDAFDIIAEKTGEEALEVFNKAMDNIMPVIWTACRRNLLKKI